MLNKIIHAARKYLGSSGISKAPPAKRTEGGRLTKDVAIESIVMPGYLHDAFGAVPVVIILPQLGSKPRLIVQKEDKMQESRSTNDSHNLLGIQPR
jgi:hypothetical protein